jgi:predicted  nucleic acid-binding Zn-ribbon protein
VKKYKTAGYNIKLFLQKNILSLKSKLKIVEDQNLKQERKLAKLNDECTKLHKTVSLHKIEMEKLKQYFKSKQNELTHHISNLKNENHHLREMCGKDIGKSINEYVIINSLIS